MGQEPQADFGGWVTMANMECSDGLTIMPGAFAHQDGATVPLVWQHGHSDVQQLLGRVRLEHRVQDGKEGVYGWAYFNDSEAGKAAKTAVLHKDVDSLSIWANNLRKKASAVMHGVIREVSLVLAGANPGAKIDFLNIVHGDDYTEVEDEAIIHTGTHIDLGDELKHADDEEVEIDIAAIWQSMSEEQQNVVAYLVNEGMKQDGLDDSSEEEQPDPDSGDEEQPDPETGDPADAEHGDTDNNKEHIMHNAFEQGSAHGGTATAPAAPQLSAEQTQSILAHAQEHGQTLRSAMQAFVSERGESGELKHGIDNIEILFPEARTLDSQPEFYKRRTEWVNVVLNGVRKSPFSRVKTQWADLTPPEARAKGYIKGTEKTEEYFAVSQRETTPQTIYKKQKLDRDDIIDITGFDVVMWMKGEMRLMLDEEIARAILIGDGRSVADPDKIKADRIRPIATDDEFFNVTVYVNVDDANSSYLEIVDSLTRARRFYRGSGTPTLFTHEIHIAEFLILRDNQGRRYYRTLSDLAAELRVSAIVPVEVMEDEPDIFGIMVNLTDYVAGADKGGRVAMFEDFDIDFNQEKYLIETRMSGALVKPKSAMTIRKTAGTNVLVAPIEPTYDSVNQEVTITDVTGVVYTDPSGPTVLTNAGSPYDASAGDFTVVATPDTGYYFLTTEDDTWVFNPTFGQ